MAKKKIISIGFEIASNDVEYLDFDSESSLLDWDIILFRPEVDSILGYADLYQGKPSLSESRSFNVRERIEHWRREINDSVKNGKIVVVFLSELKEFFIDTGERKYSGTGRNQKTTRIVTTYHNYNTLPVNFTPTNRVGKKIKLAPKNSEFISTYWKEFESISKHKIIMEGKDIATCLLTHSGDKPVGAIYRFQKSDGALVLLPDIDFDPDYFLKEVDDEMVWTKEAHLFGSKFVKQIIILSRALKQNAIQTPELEWAQASIYNLKKESSVRFKLLQLEQKQELLQKEKEQLLDELKGTSRLRNLLYEKGKQLEYSIIDALTVMGFDAEQYEDGDSEFDVVFNSKEGRLIGEAEGKDNKSINVTKLRQLSMNIHEDLEMEEIEEPAKAVLFGNPFRLVPPDERNEPFTIKCVNAAKASSTALISTPDLFEVAQYLSNNRDARFATKCRKVILRSIGKVTFPDIPVKKSQNNISEKES